LGNALWHTDSAFNQHRAKYSLLLAHSVPGEGKGKTEFADTRRAWSDLDEERKREFRDVIVEHEYVPLSFMNQNWDEYVAKC
jgi:alpha-ketoglutarate-dependent 2,4-dichlorophenoxyacetate dioxygenase